MGTLNRFASLFLLLLFGMLHSVVEAQFKMIDSSNFRMKKGVSNSSASIAFVQINHYVDPVGDQSRAFTIEQHQGDDPNLIKVHIQYQNANDIHGGHAKLLSSMETDRGEATNGPSSLHRIIENNKKRDKYNPGIRRKFKSTPQLISRKDISNVHNPIQRASILQENQRILKKLQLQSGMKKARPVKGTFKSSCKCVKNGEPCPKMQITVARCKSNELMCCF